jgi:hypothetical protein
MNLRISRGPRVGPSNYLSGSVSVVVTSSAPIRIILVVVLSSIESELSDIAMPFSPPMSESGLEGAHHRRDNTKEPGPTQMPTPLQIKW